LILTLVLRRLFKAWLQRLLPRLHMPYEIALTITRALTGVLWVIRIPNSLFFQKMFKVIDGGAPSFFEAIEPKDAMVREPHPG
jgi:hypothetical protein